MTPFPGKTMVGFPVTASVVVLSVAKTIIGGSESAASIKASITLLGRLARTSHSTLLQVRSKQKNGASLVVHGETMVMVRKTDAESALSNTKNSTAKVVSMFALTFRHPCSPLVANSCPGQPNSRQAAGGQAKMVGVKSSPLELFAVAPSSHRKLLVGTTPSGHLSKAVNIGRERNCGRNVLMTSAIDGGWSTSLKTSSAARFLFAEVPARSSIHTPSMLHVTLSEHIFSPFGHCGLTITFRITVLLRPPGSMTPKVMLYTPATFGSTEQFWMPLMSNLNFIKLIEHAVINASRFPSSTSTAVAPRSHFSSRRALGPHFAYGCPNSSSTTSLPMRVIVGEVLTTTSTSTSSARMTAILTARLFTPRGHLPMMEHVPSGHRISVPLHGFTTITRRRTTAAALPALSETKYVMTYGSSGRVTAKVDTGLAMAEMSAAGHFNTLEVTLPSKSSTAKTPGSFQLVLMFSVWIITVIPDGVTANWALPRRVIMGGVLSVGGTYFFRTTAGTAAGLTRLTAQVQLTATVPAKAQVLHFP
mmetsp:Transcript_36617/g.61712  ORF Transcript_36617/g.61712 Transcript_36617/m.61712 type:complete len:533 (+) Transcript_36617:1123-2721(+)